LPAGYGYEFAGLSRQEIKAGSSTIIIFHCRSHLFFFPAALYESWQVPFQYWLAVPDGIATEQSSL